MSTFTPTRSVRLASPRALAVVAAVALASLTAACDDAVDDGGQGGDGGGGASSANYIVASLIANSDSESSMYVSFVDELNGQLVDHASGREFPSTADLWVHAGKVFVSDYDSNIITKFRIEGEELIEEGRLGLGAYEVSAFGFWMNTFVSDDKAYIVATAGEAIIWNPDTMEIEDTLDLPTPAGDDEHLPVASYADRATQVRDGLLYQPVYYADDSYFGYLPNSVIHVIDTATDEVVTTLEVPCPGIDFSTRVGDDLYFSSWVFAPGGAAVLDGPKTCVAKVTAAAPTEVEIAFDVADVTGGLEGGVLGNVGDGRGMMSVLDPSHASEDAAGDVTAIAFGANWRFWSYDFETGESAVIEGMNWNAGAAYRAVTTAPILLAPSGDYSATTAYDVSGSEAVKKLETRGWTLRLFEL